MALLTTEGKIKGVYILHFMAPIDIPLAYRYGGPDHYVGMSEDIVRRLEQHDKGEGSKVTQKAVELGIRYELGGIFRTSKPRSLEGSVTRNPEDRCIICSTSNDIQYQLHKQAETENRPFEPFDTRRLRAESRCGICNVRIWPGTQVWMGPEPRCYAHTKERKYAEPYLMKKFAALTK